MNHFNNIQKGEKAEFLTMFYKRAFYSIFKPITENVLEGKPIIGRDDIGINLLGSHLSLISY